MKVALSGDPGHPARSARSDTGAATRWRTGDRLSASQCGPWHRVRPTCTFPSVVVAATPDDSGSCRTKADPMARVGLVATGPPQSKRTFSLERPVSVRPVASPRQMPGRLGPKDRYGRCAGSGDLRVNGSSAPEAVMRMMSRRLAAVGRQATLVTHAARRIQETWEVVAPPPSPPSASVLRAGLRRVDGVRHVPARIEFFGNLLILRKLRLHVDIGELDGAHVGKRALHARAP